MHSKQQILDGERRLLSLREVSLGYQLPVQKLQRSVRSDVIKGRQVIIDCPQPVCMDQVYRCYSEGWGISFYLYPTFRTFSSRLAA